MPYEFAVERDDYSDLAGGKVFQSLPNHPFFPIRLASEIFQRCLKIRQDNGVKGRIVLYDPCCGGAYLLGTIAYLHWENLEGLIGSDIDSQALELAARNLSLLTVEGLDKRIDHIRAMITQFDKLSHVEALESAHRLKNRLLHLLKLHPVQTTLFLADALSAKEMTQNLTGHKIDVVITDVPYGRLSAWQNNSPDAEASNDSIHALLDSLLSVVQPHTVIAICADKQQKAAHEGYRRVDHFQLGKRRITLLKPVR